VDEERAATDPGADDVGDFEYDSAHDATAGPHVSTPDERRHVQVDPLPDAGDGDYGYDLAHDMRAR
jgi:hypothetical protein